VVESRLSGCRGRLSSQDSPIDIAQDAQAFGVPAQCLLRPSALGDLCAEGGGSLGHHFFQMGIQLLQGLLGLDELEILFDGGFVRRQ
jgi:hypothetical protein